MPGEAKIELTAKAKLTEPDEKTIMLRDLLPPSAMRELALKAVAEYQGTLGDDGKVKINIGGKMVTDLENLEVGLQIRVRF